LIFFNSETSYGKTCQIFFNCRKKIFWKFIEKLQIIATVVEFLTAQFIVGSLCWFPY